jgi:prepilin-type N-terminal cleavage/methylation domain-containing protein
MTNTTGTFKQSESFTLIELLVVIAIIAILASLLLPALQSARLSAKTVMCVNNQRQVSLGVFTYTTDFDDYLPTSYTSAGTSAKAWTEKLWDTYIGTNVGVFRCPAQNFDFEGYWGLRSDWGISDDNGVIHPGHLSYQVNGCANTGQGDTTRAPFALERLGFGGKIASIAQDTIMLLETQDHSATTGGKGILYSSYLGWNIDRCERFATSNHSGKSSTVTFFNGATNAVSRSELLSNLSYAPHGAYGMHNGLETWGVWQQSAPDVGYHWNSSWITGYWSPIADD